MVVGTCFILFLLLIFKYKKKKLEFVGTCVHFQADLLIKIKFSSQSGQFSGFTELQLCS
jgi:hypothetical protein